MRHTAVVAEESGDDRGFDVDCSQLPDGAPGRATEDQLPRITGPQIRAERRRQRWKEAPFAQAIGCSVSTLKLIENPDRSPVPWESSFYAAIIEVLGLDRPAERLNPSNPDDPPVSQASKVQLAKALYRLVTDEEAALRERGGANAFDVWGRDLIGGSDDLGRPDDVARPGDDDPPSGAVQS